MRNQGYPWNHKRVYRVYCAMGLNLPRRTKRRIPKRPKQPLRVCQEPDVMWSMDFMHDRLYGGRAFRTLNILDEGVREALAIEVDTSLPAERVVRVLEQLAEWRALPEQIRVDNGPELISECLMNWCAARDIELAYIQPGSPRRTRSSNALTEPTVTRCSTRTSSNRSTMSESCRGDGKSSTTKNDHTMLSGACPREHFERDKNSG